MVRNIFAIMKFNSISKVDFIMAIMRLTPETAKQLFLFLFFLGGGGGDWDRAI